MITCHMAGYFLWRTNDFDRYSQKITIRRTTHIMTVGNVFSISSQEPYMFRYPLVSVSFFALFINLSQSENMPYLYSYRSGMSFTTIWTFSYGDEKTSLNDFEIGLFVLQLPAYVGGVLYGMLLFLPIFLL